MNDKEQAAKERIMTATIAFLSEGADPTRITIRQIAERAGVGVGSINYHFQSRDNLLNLAVMRIVGDVAASWYEPLPHPDIDPLTRLKNLFRESSRIIARYRKLSEVSIGYSLLHGPIEVPQLILPLLREIYGGQKSETDLRLLAFMLIAGLQVVLLRAEAFQRYSGLDIFDDAQRDAALDTIIDLIVGKSPGKENAT